MCLGIEFELQQNGLSASKKLVYIDINNPKRYAFATDGVVGGGSNNDLSENDNHKKKYNIKGTSYDTKKLFKTQPKQFTKESRIRVIMEQIEREEIDSINPIPVYVHKGDALIVDGHHRYEACVRLGGWKEFLLNIYIKTNYQDITET